MTRRLASPINDNQSPASRRICNELAAEMPIAEAEFALVENCFGEIIGRMLASTANGAEASDKETQP